MKLAREASGHTNWHSARTERMGFWVDMNDPYVTLEDDYIESSWWSQTVYEGYLARPAVLLCTNWDIILES